jgi:acylphosphatase
LWATVTALSKRRIVVSGRVQGVGYRVACAREASRIGISGSVRNLADGSVEVVAVGQPDLLAAFTAWCGRGPWAAEVREVSVADEPTEGEAPVEGASAVRGFRVL